jgi:hypothetical protein
MMMIENVTRKKLTYYATCFHMFSIFHIKSILYADMSLNGVKSSDVRLFPLFTDFCVLPSNQGLVWCGTFAMPVQLKFGSGDAVNFSRYFIAFTIPLTA